MRNSRPVRVADRCGFTLVELLVVIALIILMISLLLPALARARDAATKAVCMGNVRQNGLAFAMYTQEFREYLPVPGTGGAAGGMDVVHFGTGPVNHGLLFPYLSGARSYFCPDYQTSDVSDAMLANAGVGAALFQSAWPNVAYAYSSYRMIPRAQQDGVPMAVWGVMDTPAEEPSDAYLHIGARITSNMPPRARKIYHILMCHQYGVIRGAHKGEYSNVLYADLGVKLVQYDWRRLGHTDNNAGSWETVLKARQ